MASNIVNDPTSAEAHEQAIAALTEQVFELGGSLAGDETNPDSFMHALAIYQAQAGYLPDSSDELGYCNLVDEYPIAKRYANFLSDDVSYDYDQVGHDGGASPALIRIRTFVNRARMHRRYRELAAGLLEDYAQTQPSYVFGEIEKGNVSPSEGFVNLYEGRGHVGLVTVLNYLQVRQAIITGFRFTSFNFNEQVVFDALKNYFKQGREAFADRT